MKNLFISVTIVLLIAVTGYCAEPVGKITFIVGTAHIRHEGSKEFAKARIGARVEANDVITTEAESRCEITLTGDKVVRLDEKTLVAVSASTGDSTSIKSTHGMLYANVKKLVASRSFRVMTPTATAAIRGTIFGTQCDTNKTSFMVMNGAVAVKPGTGSKDTALLISSGEKFTAVKDLNKYMKEQEAAFKEFIKKDQEEFEQFRKKDQADFEKFQEEEQVKLNEMIKNERAAFTKVGELSIAKQRFDVEKAKSSDWVKWNAQLDNKLEWKHE